LRAINKVKRVEWARAHKNWRIAEWNKVLWSDEKKFELFNSKRREYCRRREGEALRDDTIQPTVKHGGGSLMFWGCFGGGKVGNLYKVKGIMDQHQYHSILVRHAIPSGNRIFSNGRWVFMHDNDPKHTSRATRAYMDWLGLDPEEWPSQSPDLNPIENLWSYLDWRLRDRHCGSLEELWAALQEGWNSIPVDYLTKLVESMPRRLQAVIDAKGYPTKY